MRTSPKKSLVPLTRHQMATGVSNDTPDTVSGFLSVESWDFVHADVVATGSAVNITFQIQSMDAYGNVVDLHTGSFQTAENRVVQLDPCPRKLIRSNISNYGSGGLNISLNLGKYSTR